MQARQRNRKPESGRAERIVISIQTDIPGVLDKRAEQKRVAGR